MAGRKSKYETVIKPNFDKIENWVLNQHMAITEVCRKLNINRETFYKFARIKTDMIDLLEKRDLYVNNEIEADYVNYAIYGRYVTEERLIYKYTYDDEGNQKEILESKEVNTRYVKPEGVQGIFTMKNRCDWKDSNSDIRINTVEDDPITISIKKGLSK